MRNNLNRDLIRQRAIPDENVKDLLALHFAMDAIVENCDKYCRADVVNVIERLEYMMQDKWEFSRQKARHTHLARLNPQRVTTCSTAQ